jgi:hypothetical protein
MRNWSKVVMLVLSDDPELVATADQRKLAFQQVGEYAMAVVGEGILRGGGAALHLGRRPGTLVAVAYRESEPPLRDQSSVGARRLICEVTSRRFWPSSV